jgi:hypothetical protein
MVSLMQRRVAAMTDHRRFFICVVFVVGQFVGIRHIAAADEYVWARSNWGSLPMGYPAGTMTNGYGGYYVRKNAYGNNYESRRPFMNPTGFIIPDTATACPAPQQIHVCPVQPRSVNVPPTPTASMTQAQGQPVLQPYRLTRIATAPSR